MKNLSTSWAEVSLGEICEFKYGKSLPELKRTGGNIPVFGSNGIIGQHNEAITDGFTIVIGRKGSLGEVNFSNVSCWPIDTTYYIDKSATDTDLKWLAYQLSGLGLTKLNKAAAVPGLNREDAYRQRLLLPPLEEQRRIAEVLDRAEELRSKRREAIAQLDTLNQSIFLEMFGDPVVNPKGWEVRNMNECAERIQIGPFGTQLHEEDYIDNGIPLINPTHIQDGKIFPNPSFSISSEKHQQLSQYHLEVDDVILGRRGEMGRCAIVSKNECGWLCGTGSLFIRPKHVLLDSFYLFSFLSSQSIKKYLEKASQGVTMANLNKTIVSQIPVILPPLPLQQEFAHRVEAVEKLKASHHASLSELDALFASLQHRAFRGEL
jgi:type I restriction enzyme S subunit